MRDCIALSHLHDTGLPLPMQRPQTGIETHAIPTNMPTAHATQHPATRAATDAGATPATGDRPRTRITGRYGA